MIWVFVLMVLGADNARDGAKNEVAGPVPVYVRRYFEDLDIVEEITRADLKKHLDELKSKLKDGPPDARNQMRKQIAQVEKTLRILNSKSLHVWIPEMAEAGIIGSLEQATVTAVLDRETLEVRFKRGKQDLLDPQFGVAVKDAGGDRTAAATIRHLKTDGYKEGSGIVDDSLFRVISTGGGGSNTLVLEYIDRSEVAKWRTQFDNENASPPTQEPLSNKKIVEPAFVPDAVEIPANVAKWRDICVARHHADVKKLSDALDSLRRTQEVQKTDDRKKDFVKRISRAEADLKRRKERGLTFLLGDMPDQPNIGDLGFVRDAVVVEVHNDSAAVVKRHERGVILSLERRGSPVQSFSVLVDGVDTRKWPKDRVVVINAYFEATHVDKSTRLVVLKPFDYAKWSTILEMQSKVNLH